jgi:hypothetical protein
MIGASPCGGHSAFDLESPQAVTLSARSPRTNLEIDHVFICCAPGAPEAEALLRLGLKEGTPNTHPGQGTACRRFFFDDAYLELFWVTDPWEAQSEPVRPTRLFERWTRRNDDACPFAIVLRPAAGSESASPPFATWAYRPSYMPTGLSIEVASDTPLAGPELFYLGFQRGRPRARQEPTDHAPPLGALTGVTLWRPADGDSAAARSLEAAGLVAFRDSDEYLLELLFEGAGPGRADLRPGLPLVLSWR